MTDSNPRAVDLTKLEREMSTPTRDLERYAPPAIRRKNVLADIAQMIKSLTWDDNEHFAEAISKHVDADKVSMAKAIQMAADELKD